MIARLIALLGALALTVATTPRDQKPVFTADGAFFALSVTDLDATIAWYTGKLGLTVVTRYPKRGTTAGALLGGNGLEVELIVHDDASDPRGTEPVLTHGIFKTGFRVDDFDGTIAGLRARGVQIAYGPYPARRDQRANAIIRDNSGNLIQIFGDYAR
ncbi:MAG TPA: VOC family protein [Gemmatimonadaceae bacterium]|nr:VOC family protein [Gemmatimonadaceae bacterium]